MILEQSSAIWYHIQHSVNYFELLDELCSVGCWYFEEIECIIIDILDYVTCHSLWKNVFLFYYQGQQRYEICVVTFISMMHYNTAIYFYHVNTSRPRQNGRHFPDDIFKWIFLNETVWIPIKISLKFVPKGSSSNMPALAQIMDWPRQGDKPLYEPMMISLPTHMCVTRPQWVNGV